MKGSLMNANAVDGAFPVDLTKRILSQGSPRLWMAHYLHRVGTKEDLDQLVWEVCLDPKHRGRLERREWLSLGGFVAAKMRREILRLKNEMEMGDSDNLNGALEDRRVPSEPEDSFEDPWEIYLEPGVRELVKDRFYAGSDRVEQEKLLGKYGLSSTSALRMRALRAVNEARRKHDDSYSKLRESRVR